MEIKLQSQENYHIPNLRDMVEKFVNQIDPQHLDGIKAIILLDNDPWKQGALGRYVPQKGTNFYYIHLYSSVPLLIE